MKDFSTLHASPADAPEPTPDRRGSRRPLTEVQRKAKNERDRDRRQQHRLEVERLRGVKFQYEQMAPLYEKLQIEFERLKFQYEQMAPLYETLQIEFEILREENQRLESRVLVLINEKEELKKKLLLQPSAEINQAIWNTATDLSISAAVQAQVNAATQAEESVIDKETVVNQFMKTAPFLFVASKTEAVSCIRLRGKCPEEGLLEYWFEWTPQQTVQEYWRNLESEPGWTPNLATSQYTSGSAQPNFPTKFLLCNSEGPLDSNRQRVVMELIKRFQPGLLVLTETRLSGARTEKIIDTFGFDAIRVTPNLGYVGAIWLLWRAALVEVDVLSFTEQEIHALIKDPQSNQNPIPWEFYGDVNFDCLQETQSLSVPSLNEQVANTMPVAEAQGRAPQTGSSMRYADELVEDFTKKLDAMEKNQVDFSDFKGLKKELGKCWLDGLPPSLADIDKWIKMAYGDITEDSQASPFIIRDCYIVFCSVIKEMDERKLEDVDEKKMLFWRDAINSGLSNGMKVNFAIDHLKKIARAYYGLKAWNDQGNDQKNLQSIEQRISELMIESCTLEKERVKKLEEANSKVRKQCIHVAQQFWGKPLSTGLFPYIAGCADGFAGGFETTSLFLS